MITRRGFLLLAPPAALSLTGAKCGGARHRLSSRLRKVGSKRAARIRLFVPRYRTAGEMRDAWPHDRVIVTPGFKPGPYWIPIGSVIDSGDIGWVLRPRGGASGP